MIDIKPCPFCGGTALNITAESDFKLLQGRNGKTCIAIRCWNCNVDMFDHTYSEKNYDKRLEMLLAKWNRRVGNETRKSSILR